MISTVRPWIWLTFICATQTLAQTDSIMQQPVDTALQTPVDSARYHFIIVDARYQNRIAFMGRDFGNTIPLLASTIMYYAHSGLWLAASEFEFLNHAPIHFQLALSAGYMTEPSKATEWSISYSQFYIPDDRIPNSSRFQSYAQTTLGLDWKILFSTIQLQALINKNSDFFITTTHSRYFQFNRFNKIKISFEPALSLSVGTRRFEQSIVVATPGGGAVSPSENSETINNGLVPLCGDFTFPLKLEIGYLVVEPAWKFVYPINTSYDADGVQILTVRMSYYIPIHAK